MTDATATVTIREEPTLRDRFAMAALAGLLTPGDVGKEAKTALIAEAAYAIADAMLEARKPKAEPATQPSPSSLEAAVRRLEVWHGGGFNRWVKLNLLGGDWYVRLTDDPKCMGGEKEIVAELYNRDLATAINAALDEAQKAGM